MLYGSTPVYGPLLRWVREGAFIKYAVKRNNGYMLGYMYLLVREGKELESAR